MLNTSRAPGATLFPWLYLNILLPSPSAIGNYAMDDVHSVLGPLALYRMCFPPCTSRIKCFYVICNNSMHFISSHVDKQKTTIGSNLENSKTRVLSKYAKLFNYCQNLSSIGACSVGLSICPSEGKRRTIKQQHWLDAHHFRSCLMTKRLMAKRVHLKLLLVCRRATTSHLHTHSPVQPLRSKHKRKTGHLAVLIWPAPVC